MLDRVRNFKKHDVLPYTANRVWVDRIGNLTLDGKPSTLKEVNKLFHFDIKSIDIVILIVFHQLRIGPVYWPKLNVLKTNKSNDLAESFIPSFTVHPLESIECPGYYLIPKYSNYLINDAGIVIKRPEARIVTASPASTGYYTLRMQSDDGLTANALRHRIMAMTFLKYSNQVTNLDVNHKNGIPGDDRLDNLEWCTRAENMRHAFQIGLRSDNKSVEIMNANTGVCNTYHSYSEAGRVLGVTETTISNRVKAGSELIYDGYRFRDFPTKEPWPNATFLVKKSGHRVPL